MTAVEKFQAIYSESILALASLETPENSDEDVKYDIIRNAYESVRGHQGAEEETKHSETPRAAMEEYLTDSATNAKALLDKWETDALDPTNSTIPDPIPEGIVWLTEGGSGSGSGS